MPVVSGPWIAHLVREGDLGRDLDGDGGDTILRVLDACSGELHDVATVGRFDTGYVFGSEVLAFHIY